MKNWIFILLLCAPVGVVAQDYAKLNLSDSLRRLIDEDSSGQWLNYSITEDWELFYPVEKTFRVKIKNQKIQIIQCQYYKISKLNPDFADECSFYIHFDSTGVLQFNTSDNSMMLDTTIADMNDRLKNHKGGLPWSLHCWFYQGELLYYYSNGHGMTERDDFDAEVYVKETVDYFAEEVKKRYPDLIK